MKDVGEVAAAVAGTPLAGLPIGYGVDGTILISDIDPNGLLESWRAAHTLIPITDRWPIMVVDDDDEPLETEFDPDFSSVDESELSALDRAARTADPWPQLQRYDDQLITAEDVSFFAVSRSGVDLTADVLANVRLPTTSHDLQRWIYQRVLSDPDLTAQVVDTFRYELSTNYWHTPNRVLLTLLPTASSWLAPHWVSYFDTEGSVLAAALRQWHQRWDVQLVASWNTMLQLIVGRQPRPGDQAWTAARQILALATHFEIHQWELAVALPGGQAWFLHRRP